MCLRIENQNGLVFACNFSKSCWIFLFFFFLFLPQCEVYQQNVPAIVKARFQVQSNCVCTLFHNVIKSLLTQKPLYDSLLFIKRNSWKTTARVAFGRGFGIKIRKKILMNTNLNRPHEFIAIMKSSLMLIVSECRPFPLIQETIAVWNIWAFQLFCTVQSFVLFKDRLRFTLHQDGGENHLFNLRTVWRTMAPRQLPDSATWNNTQ